jgi:hypothetical protein
MKRVRKEESIRPKITALPKEVQVALDRVIGKIPKIVHIEYAIKTSCCLQVHAGVKISGRLWVEATNREGDENSTCLGNQSNDRDPGQNVHYFKDLVGFCLAFHTQIYCFLIINDQISIMFY